MRRKVALATVCLLLCSMFAFLTPKSASWAFLHHGAMAEDALTALGWINEEIGGIPAYADEVDLPIIGLPHNVSSSHRVDKYQKEFDFYGGTYCGFMGAEKWATKFLGEAAIAYASGDMELGRKSLGYGIHFIQDALNPPHVFPFAEKGWKNESSEVEYENPHLHFEALYALVQYTLFDKWKSLVREAPIEPIASLIELESKIVAEADRVHNLSCSYLRQWRDGEVPTIVKDPDPKVSQVGSQGWNMTDDDIGKSIKRAASLVKGAARWANPHASLGVIYIRADGSIDPPTAPIQQDGIVYTLTSNITSDTYGIVVERDNIVIDGKGYTLQGSRSGNGVFLSGIGNVAIKNTNIKGFKLGISLSYSSNNSISGNTISDCSPYGIMLVVSSFNMISHNNITENTYHGYPEASGGGITIHRGSNNNEVTKNIIKNNYAYGITVWGTSPPPRYNKIYDNDVAGSTYRGIRLDKGPNYVFRNRMVNNTNSLACYTAYNSSVYENRIENGIQGILLTRSSRYNKIYRNTVINNTYGVFVYSPYLSASTSNDIFGNVIKNNEYGLVSSGRNNRFYHNNLISNTEQARGSGVDNVWDDGYPSGGNYWSDYNGTDLFSGPYQNETGSDGIGDTPYITGSDEQDNYPLMKPYSLGNLSVSISKDKYTYHVGDRMYVGLYVKNLDSVKYVCFAIWAELPDGSIYLPPHTHEHSVLLPIGTVYSNPAFDTITIPSIPTGTYTWHAAFLERETHTIIVEDTVEWQFI